MMVMGQHTSTAVFNTWSLTARGSQIPKSFMSANSPVSPLIPQVVPPVACLARRAVSVRMTVAPQFCANVRGITSNAWAMARYGDWVTPATLLAFSDNAYTRQIFIYQINARSFPSFVYAHFFGYYLQRNILIGNLKVITSFQPQIYLILLVEIRTTNHNRYIYIKL